MKQPLILSLFLFVMAGCETLNDNALVRNPREPFGEAVQAPFTAMVANATQPDPVVGRVFFADDKAELTDAAKEELDASVRVIAERQGDVIVEGYADHHHDDEYNRRLGYQRALAVADYLRSAGVWDERMVIRSFGETRPTTTNWKPAGQSLNRCVVISLFPQGEGMNGKEASNKYQAVTRPISTAVESPSSISLPESN